MHFGEGVWVVCSGFVKVACESEFPTTSRFGSP